MARPKVRGAAKDLSQVTAIDWARLAAFIDGEGHIAINENKSPAGRYYQYIRVIITNTDTRLIAWLFETFGGSLLRGHVSEKHRRVYKWAVSCRHAEAILLQCYAYFITKQDQAEIALAFQQTIKDKTYRKGTEIPEEIRALRVAYREQLRQARHQRHVEIHRDAHGNVTQVTH